MTPEQAKKFAAQIAQYSAPGPKGEAPRLNKEQAVAMTVKLGAQLAASDPVTGAVDSAQLATLEAGLQAANLARNPDAVAFREAILALDPVTADLATALQAGAQHIADGKGTPIDAKLQADLADVALIVTGAASADVASADVAPAKI